LLLCGDLTDYGLPDLSDPKAQGFYDDVIADADLIIVDNLSTLCRGLKENDADSWVPVQQWALAQRRAGRSVLFIHHGGKSGQQRGASGAPWCAKMRGAEWAKVTLEDFHGSAEALVFPEAWKKLHSVLVPLYAHCAFNLNPRAASIDTPLHGLIDRAHVDHMHPDALIAIAASADSQLLTEQIFGGEIGWLPWIRPGYELGLKLRDVSVEILYEELVGQRDMYKAQLSALNNISLNQHAECSLCANPQLRQVKYFFLFVVVESYLL
jgi:hypothetical protein